MTWYIVRRLLQAIGVLLVISVITFFVTYLTGNPIDLLLPPEGTAEDRALLMRQYGLDQPVYIQYLRFLGGAIQGDFGSSLRHRQPAMPMVLERLPATIQLTAAAMLVALTLAIPLGVLAAIRRGTALDSFAMALAVLGQCVPTFWLGIMLILLFAVNFQILPAFGRGGPESLILPALTLGAYSMARTARLTRSNMLEVLSREYMRTARAKGLHERVVVLRHAFKNAAIPIVTMIGLETGVLLGGAFVTETVFAWPGIGLLAIQAVTNRDVPLIQAVVFVVATMFVLINLITDLVYVRLDPRVRLH